MSCVIGYKKAGYTISFQTRGLTDEESSNIWQRLSPKKIKEYTEETGHNLLVWGDGIVAEIRRNDKGNITVWCGKEQEQ